MSIVLPEPTYRIVLPNFFETGSAPCSQLNNDLVEKTDVSGNGFIELNEMVKAFDEGTLDFTSDSIKDSFDLMKDFSQYWTSDYNGLDQKTAIDMFIRGEVAMVQAMSTNLTAISANVGDSFEAHTRGEAALNDATIEDAIQTGLDKAARITDNGCGVAGTPLDYVGADARCLLEEADVIVAKGQGNFETMHGCGLNIYYSFLCKCDWFRKRFGMEKNKGMFVRERSS